MNFDSLTLRGTRRHARHAGLLACCVLLGSSCTRQDREPRDESQPLGASATTSTSQSIEATPPTPSLEPAPPAPPTTPNPPPQFIACGKLDFYRITREALQVFELSPIVHPPHIRGGKIARQTTQIEMEQPLNVVALSGKGALVIGKTDVYRYQLGETRARRHAAQEVSEPLHAWADPRSADAFWIRRSRDGTLLQHTLSPAPRSGSDSAPAAAQATPPSAATRPPDVGAARTEELSGFERGLFTLLGDGTPLYSTSAGLRRHGDTAKTPVFTKPPGDVSLIFADSVRDRFWSASADGDLNLWSTRAKSEDPVFSAKVPGVVIDTATEGDRVAVLSLELVGRDYRPTVSIFSKAGQTHRLNVAATDASEGPPELDLCLVPARPWVVVGTRRWLQLLDWDPPRLLAEW